MPKHDCIGPLVRAGIDYDDAHALRRIAMTLHRWHELECGGGNDYASWSVVRGTKTREVLAGGAVKHGFEYDDAGPSHIAEYRHDESKARYSRIPDREAGAKKRLAVIMAKYPNLKAYIQGDPRGASLYILRPGDVPEGESADSYYSRGLAVYK